MADPIETLYEAVLAARQTDAGASRTAKLLREGTVKVAKKLAEEAVEAGHEAILGNRKGTIEESADTLYNLVVLWADAGIRPDEVWAEMRRREAMMGIAEKLPKVLPPAPPKTAAGVEKPAKSLRALRGWLGMDPPKAKARKKR